MFKNLCINERTIYRSLNPRYVKLLNKSGLGIDLHSRHDYTLNNFLNWYYTGKPQNSILVQKIDDNFIQEVILFVVKWTGLCQMQTRNSGKSLQKICVVNCYV